MATDDEETPPFDSPVDIANFVQEVRSFSILIEPIVTAVNFVQDIRRWTVPNFTLTILVVCNVIGLFFSQGTLFFLVALLIFLIAGVCLFHVHTRILDKFLPDTSIDPDAIDYGDEDVGEGAVMGTVKEFRISIIQIHHALRKSNKRLTSFYSVLKWDDTSISLKFYVSVCVMLLCLCVLPNRLNFVVFTNWGLLSHRRVWRYVNKYSVTSLLGLMQRKPAEPPAEAVAPSVVTPRPEQNGIHDKSQGCTSEETAEAEKLMAELEKDEISFSDGEQDSRSSGSENECDVKLESNPTKSGMMARLLELKRRKQQMMAGTCHGCNVSFSSILKRRHYCRHCGNHFCARCCSQKVPRSVFGATAPAAQTETVLVCSPCHLVLINKEEKVS